ncbi:hypothetical protein SAMN05216483_0129 [Streptomyces sp. 2131.1]|nr:hypothetical protein SAMN05216483_0129 [Streptomyces sp. 2131.1]
MPELDGRRLAFGQFRQLVGYHDWHDMVETVERVSAACGRAQLLFVGDAGGTDIWFAAEDGRIVQQYAGEDDLEEDEEEPDDLPGGVREVCGELSVDLDLTGVLDTVVRGHGGLAVTAPDMGHGRFPSLLPVRLPVRGPGRPPTGRQLPARTESSRGRAPGNWCRAATRAASMSRVPVHTRRVYATSSRRRRTSALSASAAPTAMRAS